MSTTPDTADAALTARQRSLLQDALDELNASNRLSDELYLAGVGAAGARVSVGQHEDAFYMYLVLSRQRPDRPEAYLGMSHCAIESGDAAGAFAFAQAAMTLEPNDFKNWYALGRASVYLRAREAAVYHLERAEEIALWTGSSEPLALIREMKRRAELLAVAEDDV